MLLNLELREWVGQTLETSPHQLVISPMKGSNSSSVFLIQSPARQKFVLRVIEDLNWLQEEPDLAQHEAAALAEAQKTGLSVPSIIAYSEKNAVMECPVVLTSFLEGNVELHPANFYQWIEELATQLAKLHRHCANNFPWKYQSWTAKDTLHVPDWSSDSSIWERAIELATHPAPRYNAVFIHRDYHPSNVLWTGNTISGIVDWINACQGPAGVDVAHCRNNLALMFDVEMADRFLNSYIQASNRFDYNVYWDIDSILDMCLPAPEFYKPWQEFGMDVIAPDILQYRTEEYLKSLLKRI